eukprot:COSAG04_NODE_1478_length_6574_cov_5.073359_3_plen_1390_part_01
MLVDNNDNNAEQGWWSDCARGVGKGCTKVKNPMYSVAFLHRLFQTLPRLASELNATAPSWWGEVAAHLPRYSTARYDGCTLPCHGCPPPCKDPKRHCTCFNRTEFLIAAEKWDASGARVNDTESGVAPSYVSTWPVFPAEHLDVDSEDMELVAVARTSAAGTFNIAPTLIGPLMLPAAVRMSVGMATPIVAVEPGGTPRPLLGALNDWLLWTTTTYRPWQPWAPDAARGNLLPFITPGIVGGVEEIGASMVINDMLLLSTGRGNDGDASAIIRLFPVWRNAEGNGPASFTGLRAKGGFVVSASYDNVTGETSGVRITSDAGVTCRMLSPCAPLTGLWCGGAGSVEVKSTNGATVPVTWEENDRRGSIFTFATAAGASYAVTPLLPGTGGIASATHTKSKVVPRTRASALTSASSRSLPCASVDECTAMELWHLPGPNPIISPGPGWSEQLCEMAGGPYRLNATTYALMYHCLTGKATPLCDGMCIGVSFAPAPIGPWSPPAVQPILGTGTGSQWDNKAVASLNVMPDTRSGHEGHWLGFFEGSTEEDIHWHLGVVTAPSPVGPWTRFAGNPVINGSSVCDTDRLFKCPSCSGVCVGLYLSHVLHDAVYTNGEWWVYLLAPINENDEAPIALWTSSSPTGPFALRKYVIDGGYHNGSGWDAGRYSGGSIWVDDDTHLFHLFLTASSNGPGRTGRAEKDPENIGYAVSSDGMSFRQAARNPIGNYTQSTPNTQSMAEARAWVEDGLVYVFHTIRWVDKADNFAVARNYEDIGVEVFSPTPDFQLAVPLIDDSWALDLQPDTESPCAYDIKTQRYCKPLKVQIGANSGKSYSPWISFAVAGECSSALETEQLNVTVNLRHFTKDGVGHLLQALPVAGTCGWPDLSFTGRTMSARIPQEESEWVVATVVSAAPLGGLTMTAHYGQVHSDHAATDEIVTMAKPRVTPRRGRFYEGAVVVLGEASSMAEQFAAAEMAVFGGNISNGNMPLPIHNLSAGVPPSNASLLIAVGFSASLALGVPPTQLQNLGRDGLRITVPSAANNLPPNSVALSGGRDAQRGAMHSVYEFLEQNKLEMLAWDATLLPDGAPKAPLRVPEADVVQIPSAEYRDLGEWPVFSNRLHMRRMRLNNNGHDECVLVSGNDFCARPHMWDSFEFASPPGMEHTIYRLMCTNGTHVDPRRCPAMKPPQDLVRMHPSWFWPPGDADAYGQVCYSNASLREYLVSQTKLVLKHSPDARWLSITQNDNENDCMRPEEMAIVEEEGGAGPPYTAGPPAHGGGRTGAQMRAVNQVADAVAHDYPELLIDTFAYEQTAWPPKKTMPASNVIIRIATETANFAPIENQTADHTTSYIQAWANISSSLSIYDYTADYTYNSLIPVPDWFTIGPDRKYQQPAVL